MDIKTLDLKIKAIAKDYLKLESKLLELICEMDKVKGFIKLGHASLFSYCKNELKLSESISYKFINVARKANKVPELKKEVLTGKITVAKAQKMTSVITAKNVNKWLELAKQKSHKELEREVVKSSPAKLIKPKEKYVKLKNNDTPKVELSLILSEKTLNKLKRVKDLNPSLSTEEVLSLLCDFYLERKDPVKKAEKALKKSKSFAKKTYKPQGELKKRQAKKRQPIPAYLKHKVMLRDKGRCTYKDCGSTRYLEYHHIKPVSHGGENSFENLRLLCSNHHKGVHLKQGNGL